MLALLVGQQFFFIIKFSIHPSLKPDQSAIKLQEDATAELGSGQQREGARTRGHKYDGRDLSICRVTSFQFIFMLSFPQL